MHTKVCKQCCYSDLLENITIIVCYYHVQATVFLTLSLCFLIPKTY